MLHPFKSKKCRGQEVEAELRELSTATHGGPSGWSCEPWENSWGKAVGILSWPWLDLFLGGYLGTNNVNIVTLSFLSRHVWRWDFPFCKFILIAFAYMLTLWSASFVFWWHLINIYGIESVYIYIRIFIVHWSYFRVLFMFMQYFYINTWTSICNATRPLYRHFTCEVRSAGRSIRSLRSSCRKPLHNYWYLRNVGWFTPWSMVLQ